MTFPRIRIAAATLCAALVATNPVDALAAGVPLETGGFESYTVSALTPVITPGVRQLGQQGWIGTDGDGSTANLESAFIQPGVVKTGTQALQVNRAANVDNYWAVLFGTNPSPTRMAVTLPQNQTALPSSRFILIDWDMRVSDAGGTGINGDLGPFFGITANDDSNGFARVLGSLGVDASTGEVMYQAPGGAFDPAGPLVNFEEWNHFAILLDYTLDTSSVFLNGVRAKSTTFADGAHLSNFSDADITAIDIAGTLASNGKTGTAYFDNLRILNGLPGDFDIDGDVDGTDLGFWDGAYASTAVGDANGDGDSDGNDFLIWQQNVGVDMVPALAVGQAVPEPASMAIVAALASIVVVGRRRLAA